MKKIIFALVAYVGMTSQVTSTPDLGDPTTCMEQKCSSQLEACKTDPQCLPAIEDCEKKCGTSTSCWTFCVPGKASPTAIDLAKCAVNSGCLASPTPNQACIAQKCHSHAYECKLDSECNSLMSKCCGPEHDECQFGCMSAHKDMNFYFNRLYHCSGESKCLA